MSTSIASRAVHRPGSLDGAGGLWSAVVFGRRGRSADTLTCALAAIGWRPRAARDTESGISLALDAATRLLVIDTFHSGANGLDLCRLARAARPELPIVMIGATSARKRLAALRAGADDYVRKSVSPEEFRALIEARVRLARHGLDLSLGPLRLDFRGQRAVCNGVHLRLAGKEFALLYYLSQHAEHIVRLDALAREVWGHPDQLHTATYRMHISKLRKKLETQAGAPSIRCLSGGYMLTRADRTPRSRQCVPPPSRARASACGREPHDSQDSAAPAAVAFRAADATLRGDAYG